MAVDRTIDRAYRRAAGSGWQGVDAGAAVAGVKDDSRVVPNAPHRLMKAGEGISAVLPAYNEESALAGTVAGLRSVLERLGRPFEIIVVDDGSTDGTPAVADGLSRADPAVRVVHHPHNEGYGAALKSGFAAARQAWVFLMDSDGQFDPAELPGFVDEASRADFVVGYRIDRADPPHRKLFAKAWAMMMRLLLGIRARDVDCAFKLMRRSYLAAMPLEAGGAFLSAEMLAKARRLGAQFAERPVKHLPRRGGRQTGGSIKVLLRAFYEMGRLWLRVRRFKPQRLPAVSS
jgi:glycosyltransferase involved in cell wall biosynthesis